MQQLERSFDVFGRRHTMRATVRPNSDPVASGSTVIFSTYNPDDFLGYPVITATIKSDHIGYASMFGWVQFVECTDNNTGTTATPLGASRSMQSSCSDDGLQLDKIPLFEDSSSPFIYFGSEPTLFDAPARVGVNNLRWRAQSFLTYIPDGVMSKEVAPILGFSWGFDVADGTKTIIQLEELDLKSSWKERLSALRQQFTGWTFNDAQ